MLKTTRLFAMMLAFAYCFFTSWGHVHCANVASANHALSATLCIFAAQSRNGMNASSLIIARDVVSVDSPDKPRCTLLILDATNRPLLNNRLGK